MSKKNKILDHLRANLSELVEVRKEIYKGYLRHGEKDVGVYIVDMNSSELTEEYINEMNAELVSKVYYSLEGDLQWNVYHILVRDEVSRDKTIKIEMGRTFARKYVRTADEMAAFFLRDESSGEIKQGLYDVWLSRLEVKGLGFVADDQVTYVDGLNRIAAGVSKGKIKNIKSVKAEPVVEIKRVNKLLDWDRNRVNSDIPSFGKINLITGPNAVGKTSILEFIEMVICGESSRNPNQKSSETIKIVYNDNEIDEVGKGSKLKYKARDAKWYGAAGTKNTLPVNFNRYNFYDSDAAYKISRDHSEEDSLQNQLLDIFSQVALGREMNELERRINSYEEKIQAEIRKEERTLKEIKSFLEKHTEALKKATAFIFNEESLLELIYESLTDLGWKKRSINEKTKGIEKLKNELLVAMDSLDQAIELGEELKVHDLSTLDSNVKKFKLVDVKVVSTLKEHGKLLNEIELLRKKVSDHKLSIEGISAFDSILKHENVAGFVLTSKKLLNLQAVIKIRKDVKKSVGEFIEFNDKEIDTQKVVNASKALDDRKRKHSKELSRIEKRMSELTESKNLLQDTLKKLRLLGVEYIETSSNKNDCPLCAASYADGELRKRIIDTGTSLITIEELSTLASLRGKIRKQLNQVDEDIKKINILSESCTLIQKDYTPEKYTVLESVGLISESIEAIKSLEEEFQKSKRDIDAYARTGIDKQLWSKYTEYCNEHGYEDPFKAISRIGRDKNKSEEEAKKFSLSLKVKQEELVKVDNKIKELFKSVGVNGSIRELKYFENMKFKLERLNDDVVPTVVSYLKIGDEKFRAMKSKVLSQVDRCESFFKQKNEFELIKKSKSEHELGIKNYQAQNRESSKRKDNLDLVLKVIIGIKQEHSKENELEEFLNENIGKIKDTFLKIHSPREFVDVKYDKIQRMLVLKRIDEDENTPVTCVSSGQRAALALSIFLTLNSNITSGPKIILLDDPVVFADDLNVLSFFDYLRSLALDGRRQIFFVTANDKVASLFRRKFRLLGNDFVDIKLSHVEEAKSLTA